MGTIICVDDEKDVVNALKRELRKVGDEVLTATSGQEALDLMADREIAVVISDMRMPEMDGAQFFRRVLEQQPDTFRILLTGYADIDAAISAVNQGEIHRYLQKPWGSEGLKLAVEQGLERYELIQENLELSDELAERNQALLKLNETLERQVEERTQQLLHSEKLSAVGRLAAGVVHEVSNPLSVGIGWVELTLQDESLGEQHRESLQMVSEELYRAIEILDNLRDFSKHKPPQKLALDLNALLEHTLDLVAHQIRQKKIELHQDLAQLDAIWADQDQLGQVLLNLIGNAIDAMDTGGVLTIRTRVLPANGNEQIVEVDIGDTGPGIAEDRIDRIFEPFYSTKGEEGTGLGLPICLGIVEEHGGELAVDSTENVGTTFHIHLPIGAATD